MQLVDFLTLNVIDKNNFKVILNYVMVTLNEMNKESFQTDPTALLSIIRKYSNLLSQNGYIEHEGTLNFLAERLSIEMINLNKMPKEYDSSEIYMKCKELFQKLFNIVTESYIDLTSGVPPLQNYSEFEKIYIPNYSNKLIATELIEEAITLIKNDINLPDKPKNQIIRNLEKILKNLKDEKTNWPFHFGAIREAVIVIAALVTIAGSKYNLENLMKAKDNLEKSVITIEETCINKNYLSYVHVDKQIFITQSEIKQISENSMIDNEVQ